MNNLKSKTLAVIRILIPRTVLILTILTMLMVWYGMVH